MDNIAQQITVKKDKTDVYQWLTYIGMSLNLGITLISEDLEILFINEHVNTLLDVKPQAATGQAHITPIIQLMADRGDFGHVDPQEFTQTYLQSIRDLARGENAPQFHSHVNAATGRTLEICRYRCPGNIVMVTFEDISHQAKKDKAFKIALNLGKAGYWTYDFETTEFALYSEYLTGLLTQEEVDRVTQNNSMFSLVHPDDRAAVFELWNDVIKGGQEFDRILRLKTSQHGILWIRSNAHPQFAENGHLNSIICFFEDVTEDLSLQDDLREAKLQAEKTLQAQNNFLARLSHEIRTPMNAVIGITDALVQHGTDPAIAAKLKLIQSSADNIMNILEGTLSHTKLDADKLRLDPQPGNPRETVETICKLWETQARKNGTVIRCHIDDKTPKIIKFDRFRYEQCLNNLLSNAVKFTLQGRIDVVLTLVGDDTDTPRLVLAVKDTGIGMTPEQQDRIFEAYTQADETISSRFGGTGLGMNITRRIIQLMGGTISVKSNIGKGSTFILALPINIKKKAVKTETKQSQPEFKPKLEKAPDSVPAHSDLNILVADDNPTNHMVISSLLGTVVGKIYQANNGKEVLDMLDIHDIDIVLMDIHMPVMDGIESTLAIRRSDKHWSDILIIAVTADPQYQQLRLCKNIGMDESLAKPVKLSSLLEAFDRVLKIDRKDAPYKAMYKQAG